MALSKGLWKPAPVWALPPNPYMNRTAEVPSTYERCKYAVTGTLLLVPRIAGVIGSVLAAGAVGAVALAGWPDKPDLPMPLWRRVVRYPIVYLCRACCFFLGFHWIKVKGRLAPRSEAPIVIANHQTFVDVFLGVYALGGPVAISAAENVNFPVFGTVIKAMQTLLVDREQRKSGQAAADNVKKISQDNRWPQMYIFPEGNTCNGGAVCRYKPGAFLPGVPVQPMIIRYPAEYLDPCWVEPLGILPYKLALRMLMQFHNRMEIEYLPPVVPTAAEKADPALFMARVQAVMAEGMGVPLTDYSFGDTQLMFAAKKLGLPPVCGLVEAGRAEKVWKLGVAELKEAMAWFAQAGGEEPRERGALSTPSELVSALGLRAELDGSAPAAGALFALFDQDRDGQVSFREFAAGLAPLAEGGRGVQGALDEVRRLCLGGGK